MMLLEKAGAQMSRYLFAVAGAAIVAMMLLTSADIVLRLFRMPIPGTYELVSFLSAVSVAFAMAHTSVQKGHIAVSVLVQLLPARLQSLIDSVTTMLGIFLFAMIAWRSFLYAGSLRQVGEVSLTLELPFYPFVYGIALSSAAVCLVLLAQLWQHLAGVIGK
mgnify:CR=1 FL=1